jgi:hypothetical protein
MAKVMVIFYDKFVLDASGKRSTKYKFYSAPNEANSIKMHI